MKPMFVWMAAALAAGGVGAGYGTPTAAQEKVVYLFPAPPMKS